MAPDDIKRIIALIEPVVREEGCEIIDAEITFEGGRKTLRLYIDRESGVNVDDCARVSHAVEDLLEVEDAVAGRYDLEVSSPGLNRPLRKREHFDQAVGRKIDVVTREKIDGRRHYKGILRELAGDDLVIYIDNAAFTVPLAQVAKARLAEDL